MQTRELALNENDVRNIFVEEKPLTTPRVDKDEDLPSLRRRDISFEQFVRK